MIAGISADLRPPDDVPRAVRAVGFTVSATDVDRELHSHHKAQVLFAVRGRITCRVGDDAWLVPPHYAVWIPGDVRHGMSGRGNLHFYCIYVPPSAVPGLPCEPFLFWVPPLLRELLRHAARMPELYDVDGPDGRATTVLLDRLSRVSSETLAFPFPRDTRLRQIAQALLANPADRASLAEWSRRTGASGRTLTRALGREVGMGFVRWRQQLHILAALQRLSDGATVRTVALELGYERSSAFIAMFRRAVGTTPARYVAGRGANRPVRDVLLP